MKLLAALSCNGCRRAAAFAEPRSPHGVNAFPSVVEPASHVAWKVEAASLGIRRLFMA